MQAEADGYGLTLPAEPVEDDDHWTDKIDLLTSSPVPWVSFTFGIPNRSVISALRRAGSTVMPGSVVDSRVETGGARS
ncbi:hypothetical protein ACFWIO_19295 [Streptomyces diastatochromogenes]|uniref:hypothetical protein n=1 Tax=Streptomyces diastatochromogenes TaxID=42236 RepID=UPI00366065D5